MTLSLGARMRRLDDGRTGVVALIQGERRIVYDDRGTQLLAGKLERWVPDDPAPAPLRDVEMMEVALEADRTLRALVLHEPNRWWQPVDRKNPPFDQGLVDTVIAYLRQRQ
jgi:hypothetical protein